MSKQSQHKIPQVYLKKFGYVDSNNQWKVSVIRRGEAKIRQKSVKSFTAETNIFNIQSSNSLIEGLFEKLNCDLETEYNNIIKDIEINGVLSSKSYAYLLQLIANMIVRSDKWRYIIEQLLKSKVKENFVTSILAHHINSQDILSKLRVYLLTNKIIYDKIENVINLTLLCFMDYLMNKLWNFSITIIKSQDTKPWYTSTNPVILDNKTAKFDMFTYESELYFPLSPDYIVFVYCKKSKNQTNPLRLLPNNIINLATDQQNHDLQYNKILDNSSKYIVIAGEIH